MPWAGKVARGQTGGMNTSSVAAEAGAVRLVTFEESGRDAFGVVRAVRAIEAGHFPDGEEADFGSFASDVSLLDWAPQGLVLALDPVDGGLAGYCWALPLNAAGEARLLRGERDGGIGPEHLVPRGRPAAAAYVTSVAVRPGWQGRRVGRRVFDRAIEQMQPHHPACLLQTAWSECSEHLLRRYAPVVAGHCQGHPIYRVNWGDGGLVRPAA